jgi:N-acetyl-alpha-D-glucosaminyl L-malate synthase BshA
MKIGIACHPTIGGSGVVATELALGLSRRGHEVHLFSYAPPARLEAFDERVQLHEVEVASYPLFRYPPYELALASRLAEVVEESGLDLVHAHYAIPHALAALLVKDIVAPRPLPVVTTLHGTDITVVGQDRSYARVTRHALERSDAVTSVSQWLADRTRDVFGTTREIVVIPNFVDSDRFRPAESGSCRRRFAPAGERVVVHVSNFRPVKRSPLVVEAFARIAARTPAVLLLVGDGPERAACEERARALGVKSRVRFLGSQTEVHALLPAADLLLLPSEHESFGLAALEAMACGVVPVATAAGGLPEVIEDGETGLLVPEERIGEIGDDAADLLADEERLSRMRTRARRAAVERFGAEATVRRYEAVYEAVAGPGARSRG